MKSRLITVLFLAAIAGCGGEITISDEDQRVMPPDPLTGTVIATDSVGVVFVNAFDLSNPNFFITHEFSGDLPDDVEPTAGRLLVLSLQDVSRPGWTCTGGIFSSDCALLDVAEQRGSPGRLSVVLASGRRDFHIQSDFTLGDDPARDDRRSQVGGSALQWRVELDEDVVDGSFFDLEITLGKVGAPNVTIRWQILIADLSQPAELAGQRSGNDC